MISCALKTLKVILKRRYVKTAESKIDNYATDGGPGVV